MLAGLPFSEKNRHPASSRSLLIFIRAFASAIIFPKHTVSQAIHKNLIKNSLIFNHLPRLKNIFSKKCLVLEVFALAYMKSSKEKEVGEGIDPDSRLLTPYYSKIHAG